MSVNKVKLEVNLKPILEKQGMSIRELSRRIDYRFESVRQLVNGDAIQIPVELVERICGELDCDINDLFSLKYIK